MVLTRFIKRFSPFQSNNDLPWVNVVLVQRLSLLAALTVLEKAGLGQTIGRHILTPIPNFSTQKTKPPPQNRYGKANRSDTTMLR